MRLTLVLYFSFEFFFNGFFSSFFFFINFFFLLMNFQTQKEEKAPSSVSCYKGIMSLVMFLN
jgi:hypothetical protein